MRWSRVIFKAGAGGTDEIKYWVMSWGPRARVLSPHSLRDEIRNEAKQMVMEYEEEESWDAP